MIARRAAHASLAAASVALVAAVWAFARWSSGRPGPGLIVSVLFCVAGFALAVLAEASGTDRGDLRLGLVGLCANLLVAIFWATLVVALLVAG
jgi:hypothetical protein